MTVTITRYVIQQGDLDAEIRAYFIEGETPAAAVQAWAERSFMAKARVEEISTSPNFGRSARTYDGAGNGAQDRSGWLYLTDAESGRFVGIYQAVELSPDDAEQAAELDSDSSDA